MKSNTTTAFILMKTITDKNGKHPIRLVIRHNNKKKRYSIGQAVTEAEWSKVFAKNLKNEDLKQVRFALEGIRNRAEEIIASIDPFSFESFQNKFFNINTNEAEEKIQIPSLKNLFDDYITRLKTNGQAGTAISYQTTINSIEAFRQNLLITDLTSDFLDDYERHLTAKSNSNTTIGIYMRQLRAIVNQAIKNKLILADDYPFKDYVIPASRNIKKALPDDDIAKLLLYQPTPTQQKAYDFWIFSYLCNGMNFADIAQLKPENIDGNYLTFIRQKTKRTKKKDLTPIRVGLHPRATEIISKQRNTDLSNPFLFPILKAGLNPLQEKYRVQRFIKGVNKNMELIREILGIKISLATYSARHTFSTVLKRHGVPTSFIKEALGHSSLITTESYLDSFPDEDKLKYANLLTNL
jgi:integrase/recombinase XerD